jgi:hypothetical protein
MTAPPVRSRWFDSGTPARWVTSLLADWHLRLCAGITAAVALVPPEGVPGLDLCMYHRLFGLPCPGCGMTRCGSCLLHGEWARAANYNPFGLVLMPTVFVLGLLALAPQGWREAARRRLAERARPIFWFYVVCLIAFITFGLARMTGVMLGWASFPAQWL